MKNNSKYLIGYLYYYWILILIYISFRLLVLIFPYKMSGYVKAFKVKNKKLMF